MPKICFWKSLYRVNYFLCLSNEPLKLLTIMYWKIIYMQAKISLKDDVQRQSNVILKFIWFKIRIREQKFWTSLFAIFAKDKRLRSKRNLGDLKLHFGPSLSYESQSATYCDNCRMIGLPAGHKRNGVKALLESLVKGLDGKYSAETQRLISANSSFNLSCISSFG